MNNPYQSPTPVDETVLKDIRVGWYAHLSSAVGAAMIFVGTFALTLLLIHISLTFGAIMLLDKEYYDISRRLIVFSSLGSAVIAGGVAIRSYRKSLDIFRRDEI